MKKTNKNIHSQMKNQLDERQEQTLLKIEHNGCWLAFWGLLIAMAVQMILYGPESMEQLAGEWIIFMILALYLGYACKKEGIWDRHLQPNLKTNLMCSLLAGLIFCVVMGSTVWNRYPDKPVGSLAAGLLGGGIVFVICFVALMISAHQFKKRQQQLEEEPDETQ